MKLQFKHQKFQADAAKAVCDVFAGQPYMTPTYMIDKGISEQEPQGQGSILEFTGFNNHKIIPELNDSILLENINKIQRVGQIEP